MGNSLERLPSTFSYSQALRSGLAKRELYRLRDEGRLERIGRGLYRRADAAAPADPDLIEIALRAPRATLCLTTALARHGLSDAIPAELDIAIPRGERAHPTQAPVHWHRFDAQTFGIGRDTLALESGLRIGVYTPERCIIDALRMRAAEGPELGHVALRRWLRVKGAQPARLLTMAKAFPRTLKTLRHALEILL